jgi:NADPH2:quinone reductase
MKAWMVRRWCKPEEMEFAETPIPEPQRAQALVRIEAAALNFMDTLMIQGLYQVKPPFPFTPGVEIAGTVEQAGPDSGFRPGDRVCAMIGTGGFAEYVAANDRDMLRLPDTMTTLEGAVFPVVYPTAHLALRDGGRLKPGETVLVHAGAGGVGLASIQVAKAWGARVIATAGGSDKTRVCREQGADLAIDYETEAWVDKVKEYTEGRGADIIIDMVGGEVTEASLKSLAWRGRLMVIGFAGGRIPTLAANRLLLKSASAIGVFWGGLRGKEPEFARSVLEDLLAMYRRGEIKPTVSHRYALSEAPQALADLATRKTHGKVVLVP